MVVAKMLRSGMVALLAVVSLVGCTAAVENVNVPAPSASPERLTQSENPKYQVNEDGQTYGSSSDAVLGSSFTYEEMLESYPDLVAVATTDGKEAYVYAAELMERPPANPEEALKYMEEKDPQGRLIVAYESDGKTVVGHFKEG